MFQATVAGGGVIKALNAKGLADLTQGEIKNLEEIAKSLGAKGLAFIKMEGGEWKSPIVKFFSEAEKAELTAKLGIGEGDAVFFAAAPWEKACAILGRIAAGGGGVVAKARQAHDSARRLEISVGVDFPLMSHDEAENRYVATHHPFTAPVPEDAAFLDTNPKAVRGQHYDVVLNGMELGGGSIRIHQPALQKKVFEDVLKIPADVVESRFGYMLKAFTYGAPPHGGIAFGLDRMVRVALRNDEYSRRDCVSENAKRPGSHGAEPNTGDAAPAEGAAHSDGDAGVSCGAWVGKTESRCADGWSGIRRARRLKKRRDRGSLIHVRRFGER